MFYKILTNLSQFNFPVFFLLLLVHNISSASQIISLFPDNIIFCYCRLAKYQHHDEIDNELDEELDYGFEHSYEEEPRYLRGDLTNDDVLNTKFVISEQEAAIAIKLAELKAAAHFR